MRQSGIPGDPVDDRVTRLLSALATEGLLAAGRTVAVAESCTGGGVCEALTALPGSSGYFLGGVVAYGNASKIRDLGVPSDLIDSRGAVSREVAEEMDAGGGRVHRDRVGGGPAFVPPPASGRPRRRPRGDSARGSRQARLLPCEGGGREALRSFIGIGLPRGGCAALAGAISPLGAKGLPVSWIPERNLHLTLKFLGEIPSGRIDEVAGLMAGGG